MAEPQNSPAEPLRAESDGDSPTGGAQSRPTALYVNYRVEIWGDSQPRDGCQVLGGMLHAAGLDNYRVEIEAHAGDCSLELCGGRHVAHVREELLRAAQAWRDKFEARLSRGVTIYTDIEQQLWEAVYAAEGREFPLKRG